jgi:uncharacterized protein YnzC (UPF0291/DUF896 family)
MFINHSDEVKKQAELRKKKINEVFELKKKQTNETKKELEEQRAYRDNYLSQLQQVNQSKFKNIKKQRIEGKQKINRFLTQRKELYKIENEREMESQERVKKEKIDEINKLEKTEMALISKLQNTQTVQVLAYEKLEAAISLPPQEFKKKYEEDIKKSEAKNHVIEGSEKKHKEGEGENCKNKGKEKEEEKNEETKKQNE